ncbi:MAG: glycosyltransferase family 2 protein [Patescibacteria group bacterium]|nr:glycosyltransferase family 2 protein [Patescibacteria group bacterium]
MKRFYEILPAALSWLTIILMVIVSWQLPFWAAIFIILFDIYWLLKTLYLSLHLRATFNKMREVLKTNWKEKLAELRTNVKIPFSSDQIYHLIILPTYNEPYEIIRETFESLKQSNYQKEKLVAVLAIEERAGNQALEISRKIESEYAKYFSRFLITIHPINLPGEIPGKGSNETWALKKAKEQIIDPLKINYDKILVSVFDIDTHVSPDYFNRLSYVFLTTENRQRFIYQPIPLFINNIFQAPALARVVAFSSTFWQMMQQARPERLTTFSSQSIPLMILLDVGYWKTDAVSEDSMIFWQGYLHYHGEFGVMPLYFPLSMDANTAPTFWKSMKNLYKQQRRWGWGVENVPYVLDGFSKDPLIPRSKKIYWTFNLIEGFHSWATNALIIFALGWLPVLIGGSAFNHTLLSYSLPTITRWLMTLSMVGIISSAIVNLALLPPKPSWFRWYHYFLYFLQWLLMPITLIIFGAFPGLESQTRLALGGKFRLGFWVTPKMRKLNDE